VQQADLQQKAVFQAGPELVNKLRQAKNVLTNLIPEGVGSNK
jgi:hypothetical protein